MIKTTIVIPNYNGIEYIENCLKSVLTSDSEVKITVVDNGSTDGSKELVKEKFPMVKLIELGSNTGFCHACNEGIKSADTKYIFLLNNDTTIRSDTVSRLENALDNDSKAFCVQSKMMRMSDPRFIDSAGDFYCALGWAFAHGKDVNPTNSDAFSHGIHKITSGCGGATLYNKAVIDRIGMLDENHFAYLEDVDWGLRAYLYGYHSLVNYDSVVLHAGSAASGSRYNEFKVKLSSKNSVYLIYKNMPALMVILNLPFILLGYLIKLAFFIVKGLGVSYFNGILKGLDFCMTDEAKAHKIRFTPGRLGRYISFEIMLLVNILRRLGEI